MKNSKVLFRDFVKSIRLQESPEEIDSMAYLVFDNVLGLSRTQILGEKEIAISDETSMRLEHIAQRLSTHEPVQYVLGEGEFFGRMFHVCPSVLIPRPETEDLVREIIQFRKQVHGPIKVLDIGTGSGCIPVTLARELTHATISATDISEEALTVARQNAHRHHAAVSFIQHDILTEAISLRDIHVVVSNPPYIAQREAVLMNNNVMQHEPHLALFVPDEDPLKFYKAITQQAASALSPAGLLIFEINERFGQEVALLLREHHFEQVHILKDLAGKDRIVKGILKNQQL